MTKRTRGRKIRRRQTLKRPRQQSSNERGYDGRWRKARRAFLNRPENVLCRHCEAQGRFVEAECVDHIQPHRGNSALFWNQRNWQPLCNRCHSIKTAKEDGGFGNRKGSSD